LSRNQKKSRFTQRYYLCLSLQLNTYFSHWVIFSFVRWVFIWVFGLRIYLGMIIETKLYIWIIMEINLLLISFFFFFDLQLNYFNNLVHYYLIQVVGGLGLFLRIFLKVYLWDLWELMFLVLKMGMAPFHFWYFIMLGKLNWGVLFVLVGPSKFLILLILLIMRKDYFLVLLVLNIFVFLLFRFLELKLKFLLGLRSIFNFGWILFLRIDDRLWLFFYVGYVLNLYFIVEVFKFIDKRLMGWGVNLKAGLLFYYLFFIIFILGVPPFLMFLIKGFVIMRIISRFFFGGLVLLVLTLMVLVMYLWIFFLSVNWLVREKLGSLVKFYGVVNLLVVNILLRRLVLIYYLNNKLELRLGLEW
jgi:NADH-ubiquinone oxidoreductase chain 2